MSFIVSFFPYFLLVSSKIFRGSSDDSIGIRTFITRSVYIEFASILFVSTILKALSAGVFKGHVVMTVLHLLGFYRDFRARNLDPAGFARPSLTLGTQCAESLPT